MMRMRGAPKPIPARPAKTTALVESLGWTVARPTMPAVKMRKPANKGSRIVRNLVLA